MPRLLSLLHCSVSSSFSPKRRMMYSRLAASSGVDRKWASRLCSMRDETLRCRSGMGGGDVGRTEERGSTSTAAPAAAGVKRERRPTSGSMGAAASRCCRLCCAACERSCCSVCSTRERMSRRAELRGLGEGGIAEAGRGAAAARDAGVACEVTALSCRRMFLRPSSVHLSTCSMSISAARTDQLTAAADGHLPALLALPLRHSLSAAICAVPLAHNSGMMSGRPSSSSKGVAGEELSGGQQPRCCLCLCLSARCTTLSAQSD